MKAITISVFCFFLLLSLASTAQITPVPEEGDSITGFSTEIPAQERDLNVSRYDNSSKQMFTPAQFERSKVVALELQSKKLELLNTTDEIQIRILEREIRNLEEESKSLPVPPDGNAEKIIVPDNN